MREDCKADRSIRDALDRRDNILAFAIRRAGVNYDDAARQAVRGRDWIFGEDAGRRGDILRNFYI